MVQGLGPTERWTVQGSGFRTDFRMQPFEGKNPQNPRLVKGSGEGFGVYRGVHALPHAHRGNRPAGQAAGSWSARGVHFEHKT